MANFKAHRQNADALIRSLEQARDSAKGILEENEGQF